MSSLFAYGTLLFPAVMRAVAGRALAPRAAVLDGYVRRRVIGELFPAVIEASDRDSVAGVLYLELDQSDWRRLDRFEGELYERRAVLARCDGERRPAFTYVLGSSFRHRLGSEPWDAEIFGREHLDAFLARLDRMRDPRATE